MTDRLLQAANAPFVDRSRQLVRDFCLNVDTNDVGTWKKYVMRGDPVSRGIAALLRAISTDWPMENIVEASAVPSRFDDYAKWPGAIVAAVLLILCVIFLIVAIVMLPLCCCKCYRNCWGAIFCRRCVQDRKSKRADPLSTVTWRKQSCLSWTVGILTILGILLSLLALAYGIKFAFTPNYALCQFGRMGLEIEGQKSLLNPQETRCTWIPATENVSWNPAVDAWVNTPTDTSSPATAITINVMDAQVWNVLRDVYTQVLDSGAIDNVESVSRYIFIAFVAMAVLALFGLIWGCALLFRLRRYHRNAREPRNLKKYARVFAFLWGWYAFFGLLLLILTIPMQLGLGMSYSPCRLIRRVPRDPSLLRRYSWFDTLYVPTLPTNPATIFTRFAFEGMAPFDICDMAFANACTTAQQNGIPVTFINEEGAKAIVNSFGSTIDGVCGGMLSDLIWIIVPGFLVGLIYMVLWPIAYKISHYFYDRARQPNGAKVDSSPAKTTASPSTMLAEALRGDLKEFNNLVKDIDPKTVRDPNYDNTTLHCAAYSGDLLLVRECLNRGVPVDSLNRFGYTALAVAAAQGHAHVVEELIKAGANASLQDEHGETPMHVAARGGDLRTVTALCTCGVDATVLNDVGELPVDIAAHHKQLPVEEYLDVRTPKGARKTPQSFQGNTTA